MDLLEYLSRSIKDWTGSNKSSLKAQMKWDMIKAIINSYPAGTPIRFREFSDAVGFKPGASSIYMVLGKMIDAGEIRRIPTKGPRNGNSYAYEVLKPGNTYDKEREELGLKREGYVNLKQVHAQRHRRAREAELLAVDNGPVDNDAVVHSIPKGEKTYTFAELEELAIKQTFYAEGMLTVPEFLKILKED